MRAVLALSLLIALSVSANAAKVHQAKSQDVIVRHGEGEVVPPGWYKFPAIRPYLRSRTEILIRPTSGAAIGSPPLHIRSFQLSQRSLSVFWISAAPAAIPSSDGFAMELPREIYPGKACAFAGAISILRTVVEEWLSDPAIAPPDPNSKAINRFVHAFLGVCAANPEDFVADYEPPRLVPGHSGSPPEMGNLLDSRSIFESTFASTALRRTG